MSVTAIEYDQRVGRWQPNASGRLAEAALALYLEQGYENTTVAEIAKRAGLTERTFFRHFADKREVLFSGSEQLRELMVNALTGAPEQAAPMEAIGAAIQATAVVFADRERVSRRQAVIAANPELQERELIKLAWLASGLAEALRERGVTEPAASLCAQSGIAVFRVAFERWVGDAAKGALGGFIQESFDELRTVAAGR